MYEQDELFNMDELFDVDGSPIEHIKIITTTLHYDVEELKELKKMCKILIKHYWGDDYREGNVNDLILKVFRNECKKITGQETIE